jgi:hypothetical protein
MRFGMAKLAVASGVAPSKEPWSCRAAGWRCRWRATAAGAMQSSRLSIRVTSRCVQVCAGAPGPWQASIGWSCRCRIERNPCVVRRTWVANQMQGERLQARWHGASRMTEKKKTSQNRPQPGPGRSDASTERKWHSSPGRTGFVFRRSPAMLVAVRTSCPVASPETGQGRALPRREVFKSCPELSLCPGLAGALFLRGWCPRRASRCCGATETALRHRAQPSMDETAGTLSRPCPHFLDGVFAQARRGMPAIDLSCPFRLRSGRPWRRFRARNGHTTKHGDPLAPP